MLHFALGLDDLLRALEHRGEHDPPEDGPVHGLDVVHERADVVVEPQVLLGSEPAKAPDNLADEPLVADGDDRVLNALGRAREGLG